ncbi:unnamed protein product, partial [Nesidiocoris tenuis]
MNRNGNVPEGEVLLPNPVTTVPVLVTANGKPSVKRIDPGEERLTVKVVKSRWSSTETDQGSATFSLQTIPSYIRCCIFLQNVFILRIRFHQTFNTVIHQW